MFDWREFLKVAKFLQDSNEDDIIREAALRCAVSRAYYAVFCYTRNYARDKLGFVPKERVSDHTKLKVFLRSKKRTAIACFLDDLRKWRNMCDYDDHVDNIETIADNALDKARNALAKINPAIVMSNGQ